MPRPRERFSVAATPHKSPVKIPLNDDEQEKASRLQHRHAIQEAQANSIRLSATPARRRISHGVNNSPRTPANDGDDIPDVAGTAVTPMKRQLPILAQFEEWMKLATDNKINASNSWNFALIDYFHEMSLLKEGDGVNFQKASCTLDGCVKIYTSRVESVATDTGKLLSGLAESRDKKKRGTDADGDGEGDDDEGEEGEDGQKKRKKRTQRTAEATLVDWSRLTNDKMELELSVDPLFKKASADFDEGGAKGLLLNHLAIDKKGRIVFDSSDDAQDVSAEQKGTPTPEELTPAPEELNEVIEEEAVNDDIEIDISGLAQKYFADLSQLDTQDVCPSMKNFDLGDTNASMNLPFLKSDDLSTDESNDNNDGNDEEGNRSGLFLDDDNPMGFDDDGIAGLDLPPETGFGEGGEAWAREAAIEPQARVHNMALGDDDVIEGAGDGEPGTDGNQYGRTDEQENILNYFDNALRKNWAGPEHWRIRRIKDIGNAPPPAKRKEKEPFMIDFSAPMTQAMADAIYTPATSASTITLSKTQYSKDRNLLPDDKHFNSRRLLHFFLKPKARPGMRQAIGARSAQQQRMQAPTNEEADEAYWARQEQETNAAQASDETVVQGNYNADFYQDDGLGDVGAPFDDDDDFADARDHFSPPVEDIAGQNQAIDGILAGSQEGAFGSQLVAQNRRFRPQYIQFARVAKRVDARLLKENLWRAMPFENVTSPTPAPEPVGQPSSKGPEETTKFTSLVNDMQTVYPKQKMDDISTSYCFICLLHLANEKGLVIENQDNFEDLSIRRDFTADLSAGHE
ncbi:barren [Lophiostoma macrostomum CBS 122681]|uniref:Condensin complex subunit 2 n=1 Tax=Lophiostoma macrostomum CBS 122681 TaxID=1314788 RepID=A0A6A6SPD4_9PLEO|nr:barren [Lophiostoma macrostomum CBS 122681]